MNILFLLLDIGILFISSYIITWFFAIYLRLNPWHLFFVFAGLNFFNAVLQTYLIPFRILANAHHDVESYQIFGIGIFALFTGTVNLGLLASRFDWPTALLIGISSFLVGPLVYGTVWAVLSEKIEHGKTTEVKKESTSK
jgi:hypothetical protein